MPATKRIALHIPDSPPLSLTPEMDEVANYLSAKYCAPKGTAIMAMFAVFISLRSRGLFINWQGEGLTPSVQIFLQGGLTEPGASLLDFLIKPIHSITERQALCGIEHRNSVTELGKYRTACLRYPPGTPPHKKFEQLGRRLWDSTHSPRLLLRPLKKADDCYDHSPLLIGLSRQWVKAINYDVSNARLWLSIFCGRIAEFGPTSPCTVLCYVGQKDMRDFTQGEFGHHKSPTVLPGRDRQLTNQLLDHTKAQEAWAKLVAKAAEGWSSTTSTIMSVDEHGACILSELKTFTESIRAAGEFPQRYTWALPTCMALAAIDHGIRRDGREIHADSWAFALALTRWAVNAHTAVFRRVGRTWPCSPHAEDVKRMSARIEKDPAIKFWQLLRALPRRPHGYWKQLYDNLNFRKKNDRTDTTPGAASRDPSDPSDPSDPRNWDSNSLNSGRFDHAPANNDPFSRDGLGMP